MALPVVYWKDVIIEFEIQKTQNNPQNKLEPVGAVGDPPTQGEDGDGGRYGPPEGQEEVGDEAEDGESEPEHFLLHRRIVGGKCGVWRCVGTM